MSTVPADRLTAPDAETLSRLSAEAEDRLRADAGGALAATLAVRLRLLGDKAATCETEHGLGVFVHARHAEIVRLPTGVRDRIVVADTFATGDLVVALRHAPRYLLLLLADDCTSLYDGTGHRLEERRADGFRVMNPWWPATVDPPPVGNHVDVSLARSARHRAYLRRVDATLDDGPAPSALPIVLAGRRQLTAAFLAITARPELVVGTLRGHDSYAALDDLGRLAYRVIQSHSARQEREAVAALAACDRGRVAAGIADVWPAVLRGQAGTLLVEEPCTYPARLTGDGLSLRPAPREGGRGVVADAIGELAWAVKFYGGDIIVVPEGTLVGFDGIALLLDDEPAPAS